ncbi:hypothetical protein ACN47E_001302 [Coniothyrium glycines]
MASTFSYAQAAKGIVASGPNGKLATSAVITTKDGANDTMASSWAEDVEIASQTDRIGTGRDSQSQTASPNVTKQSHSADTSSVSSPDLGASSFSTVTKDDDVSSIPNTSSESTWDNKSQASTSADKTAESNERTSEKVKKGKNAVAKSLQEASPPAVNPWKMRADELKAKASKLPNTNGMPLSTTKRSDSGPQEKNASVDNKSKIREEPSHGRRDAKEDSRKPFKGRVPEKDARAGSNVLPPPRDQESWPTPETAIDEDRKKAQERGEKAEKERKEGASAGKQEWVKVPYTPSVVFSTPLPNAASARRGGRPGGRGGAQPGGRPTTSGGSSNGAGQSEKDSSASHAPKAEQVKQERLESPPFQETTSKDKRTNNAATCEVAGQVSDSNGEATVNGSQPVVFEPEAHPRKSSESLHTPGQNHTYARQYPSRASKGRRGDFAGVGDRRRNGDTPLTKDNTLDERRGPGAFTESAGEVDRQGTTFQDAPNGHHVKQGRYNSFSTGRERGRGGRGARASYSNGHQFSASHHSIHASTVPMGPQSPTTFTPGGGSFFAPSQGKYARTGHRSQSVTTDAYRYVPYQNASPSVPLQSYGLYDYNMMQPISPIPFTHSVDYHALVAVIATQVEYYFSVDNLLKDMYLRRHMDSQGFVSLKFIAGFNRIKTLSNDLDIIKYVCQQSDVIEYRVGEDGLDRLRRREGWSQWVLSMAERDVSAQNEGPKELHQPPLPRFVGIEQPISPRWAPLATANGLSNVGYPQTNGDHNMIQDVLSDGPPKTIGSSPVADDVDVTPIVNGHLGNENSINA